MIKARIPPVAPELANLRDYSRARQTFSWKEAEKQLRRQNAGQVNIIAESLDFWADDPQKAGHPALIFEANGCRTTFSYRQMRDMSARWANLLTRFGFAEGDRLLLFLPPCPETYFAMAGAARMGVMFCPVFSTSGFYELEVRLDNISPRAVLTHPDLVEQIPVDLSARLSHILLVCGPTPDLFEQETIIENMTKTMSAEFPTALVPPDTPLYLIYTSGSTRPPKGIVHTHSDITGMQTTARWVLNLKDDTVLWTDADPAWVTGTVYGAFAPWLCGVTSVIIRQPFTAANWYRALEDLGITTWYTTPRVLRDLMEAGDDLPTRYDLSALTHICTVGAPLPPEMLYWTRQHIGATPHDTWWMTETGMICIANLPGADIKPGSVGRPLPGIEAAILDDNGEPLPALSLGELALRPGWPGQMSQIWKEPDRFAGYFKNGWFVTGDIAVEDEEGYFYHQGRNDDLIKAGDDKVIGPFEIEQVLCMHPAVAEAAVISKGREPGRGISHLKAYVTLKQGYTPSNRLKYEIRAFLKGNLSSELLVRELVFLDKLPKTISGKLLRRVLRARELGLPGGEPSRMQD
ncbi:MAG: AMP-binding protein [Desulfosalsimonas sp.]|uniref:AMP-binding protein n=1 Tax=Desulfosalsimonas sp. TaxID=3073848 RepID=UPI003970A75E